MVKSLFLDVRRRDIDRESFSGITPIQVKALAQALPDLPALGILCGDGGGWLDADMITAMRAFNRISGLAIESTGFTNAARVFTELATVRELHLRKLTLGWLEAVAAPTNAAIRGAPLQPNSFASQLVSLVLEDCVLDGPDFAFLFGAASALDPSNLKHLSLDMIRGPRDATRHDLHYAIAPAVFLQHVARFLPGLVSLRLVLAPSPALPRANILREMESRGLYRNGRLLGLDPGTRAGTQLARHLGADLQQLTIGGPFCVDEDFFHQLSTSPARPREVVLTQCAFDCSLIPSEGGLSVGHVLQAIDMEWASHLELLDISNMEDEFDTDDGTVSAFDWDGVQRIQRKLDEIASSPGGINVQLVHSTKPPRAQRARARTRRR